MSMKRREEIRMMRWRFGSVQHILWVKTEKSIRSLSRYPWGGKPR